jgi:hypothetical protein
MKKITAIILCALLCAVLAVTALAASHAESANAGKELFADDFSGDALDAEKWDAWSGYAVTDGKLHLGHGASWIDSSPGANTNMTFKNYIAEFDMSGDGRDCYYGFGLRAPVKHTEASLFNGGRFGVPAAEEKSTGIAIDIFGAGNSTLKGEALGITFCDGNANGSAPTLSIPYANGFDGKAETHFKVVDSGAKITIYAANNEIATIELSGLSEGSYTKAAVFGPDGASLGSFDVTVAEEGALAFYQRNDHITVDNLKVNAIASESGEQPGDTPATPENPKTADASVIAIAAVACIALAGVVVAKKVR